MAWDVGPLYLRLRLVSSTPVQRPIAFSTSSNPPPAIDASPASSARSSCDLPSSNFSHRIGASLVVFMNTQPAGASFNSSQVDANEAISGVQLHPASPSSDRRRRARKRASSTGAGINAPAPCDAPIRSSPRASSRGTRTGVPSVSRSCRSTLSASRRGRQRPSAPRSAKSR